jgi:hypothetical protein
MTDLSAELAAALKLSLPTIADGEIRFSAFGPGWGFCSYAVPAGVARESLGARDLSESQLLLAFQLNRQRIAAAVAEGGVRDPGTRVILSKI